MKKITISSLLTACFMIFCLILPALAQQQAEELKGKEIRNEQGEQIGTIEEIHLSSNGNIEAVTIEKGGFLGIGGEERKISWNSLKQEKDADYLIYTPGAEREQMQTTARQQESQAQITRDQQPQQQEKEQLTAEQEQRARQENGQIAIQQPGAQITVDQAQPQVRVDQPEPKVTVRQPAPKVTVKQFAPKITVQVEQPEPEVTVQQQQPQVDIQQQDPQVSVQQQKPEVTVQQQEPEVSVQRSEPVVQVDKADRPEVYIEKQEQAIVEIQRQGQPQVEVITDQRQQEAHQTAGQQQQPQSPSMAAIDAARADDLIGRNIVSRNGENLGTVEKVYLTEDRNFVQYLIVQGDQNKLHPVPAELVQIDEDRKELTARISKQTFADSPSFRENDQPQLDQQQWSRDIQNHYGISPAWQQPGLQQPSQQPDQQQ